MTSAGAPGARSSQWCSTLRDLLLNRKWCDQSVSKVGSASGGGRGERKRKGITVSGAKKIEVEEEKEAVTANKDSRVAINNR